MDGNTAPRVAEHRDILKGFDAQIARLGREEDELFGKIIRAKDREGAQVVFDGLAKVKGQKEKLGTLKKEEIASFERWVSQDQVRGLPTVSRSDDDHRRRGNAVRLLPTDVIDLSFDEETEVPVKQEASSPTEGNLARDNRSSGGRQQRSSTGRSTESPFENVTALLNEDSFASFRACSYPSVAQTHPTVIYHPTAEGAIELRCPYCKTNMNKDGVNFLNGVNGFCLHLNNVHKDFLAPGTRFSHKRTFELCSYRTVPQGVVDAIESGNLGAYVVEEVYQRLKSDRMV
ncbi:hypothetical protein D0869_01919 [Hortaea werneckii]|uniref:Uncharacterized protein n=1 Tax=Hortaea werneckii TaxID=91943 RepID=A0A3M6XC06_HORWE|nr:hypothetical protein D0869_01919 [Hortaea werneckii]RMX92940.1 hypothetical protein D0867_14386 [Hortaea werneckii]RMY09859.1 hypothetical protein D0866_14562 [Hortaea werneckii]